MFTSKKHIDRLNDSIVELYTTKERLHTDKERLQRIIHKQSEIMRGLAVSVKQQAKVIQSLSEENRKLKGECLPVESLECHLSLSWKESIENALKEFKKEFIALKSERLRDEKGRFRKRK